MKRSMLIPELAEALKSGKARIIKGPVMPIYGSIISYEGREWRVVKYERVRVVLED